MKLSPALVQATFIARPNRFLALVRLDGREIPVHVANSGRLGELLVPGVTVFISPAAAAGRKTDYDLTLVDMNGVLVCTDARLPNTLLTEAVEQERLPEFRAYGCLRREVPLHESRIDLELSGGPGLCYIEAKSVTLVEEGVGLFPDAPTVRGRKHLRALERAVEAGHRAAVAFVVQRPDAATFSVNHPADEEFAAALKQAAENGVEVYAYTCLVTKNLIEISQIVPFSP